jgi:hypothetical protein
VYVPADRVIIEELFLRFPGLTRDEARAISREVAERVGNGLAEALPPRSLGALDLRITVRAGARRDEMVDSVACAILGALSR